jgi:hypothetical protein
LFIEYDVTLEDYVDFNIYYQHSFLAVRILIPALGMVVILALLSLGPIAVAMDPSSTLDDGIAAIVSAACILVVAVPIFAWLTWRGPPQFLTASFVRYLATRGDTSSMFGRTAMTISADQIAERGPKSEQRFSISAVQKIVLAPQHIYIFVTTLQAFIIPRRAFADPREAEAVVALLEQLVHVKAIRA